MKKNIQILFLLALWACSPEPQQTSETQVPATNTVVLTETQSKTAGLQLGKATFKTMPSILKVSGKIDVPPQNMISISCPMGGYLRQTKLLPGMHVRKGEVLATLEDAQYIQLQQDFLITQVKLNLAEKEFERQKSLNASQAGNDKNLQNAQAEVETQRIMRKAFAEKMRLLGISPEKLTENNLSKSVFIFSPIDGFVSKVNVNIGKYISPSDVLFELVNPADIHLNLQIFERDLPKIAIGQKVWCYTPNNPTKKYPAKIILISKDVDENRVVEVHCHFEQYDKTLIQNMFMNAEISTHSSNIYTLPEEAILNFEDNNYVFVQTNTNYDLVKVEIGEKINGLVAVSSRNIDFAQQNIVLANAYSLLMKLKNTEE